MAGQGCLKDQFGRFTIADFTDKDDFRILSQNGSNRRLHGKVSNVDLGLGRAGDFDLTTQAFDMSFEPSIGLEQWFASKTADDSSRNLMRLRNPGIDRLIGRVIEAATLDELKTSVRALDRALRAVGFDIPLWYNPETWVAYYDFYRHPDNLPPLQVGEMDFWWFDAEAEQALRAAGAF